MRIYLFKLLRRLAFVSVSLLLIAGIASASFVQIGKGTQPATIEVTDGDVVTYYLNACNPTNKIGTPVNQTITIRDTYPDNTSQILATNVFLKPGECWKSTIDYTVTGTETLEEGKIKNTLQVFGTDELGDDLSASVEHKNSYTEPYNPNGSSAKAPGLTTLGLTALAVLLSLSAAISISKR